MSSEEDASRPEHHGGGRRWLLRRILLAAVVAFVVGFAITAIWMRLASPARTIVTVPNLRELSLSDARRTANDFDLVIGAIDSLPHAQAERGHVLTQTPLPGQEVAPGTPVQVIVSSGRARHEIPSVVGISRERAELVLRATGLEPHVEEVHDQARAGLVVGIEPAAGTVVAVPARVRLRVSLGPPMVAVPNLLGLHQDSVPAALSSVQLVLGEVRRELRFFGMEGEVLAQEPAAGDSLPAGSPVDITTSTTRLELISPEEILRPLDRPDDDRGVR